MFITAFDALGMSSDYPAPVAETQTYIKGYNTRPADLTVLTLNVLVSPLGCVWFAPLCGPIVVSSSVRMDTILSVGVPRLVRLMTQTRLATESLQVWHFQFTATAAESNNAPITKRNLWRWIPCVRPSGVAGFYLFIIIIYFNELPKHQVDHQNARWRVSLHCASVWCN